MQRYFLCVERRAYWIVSLYGQGISLLPRYLKIIRIRSITEIAMGSWFCSVAFESPTNSIGSENVSLSYLRIRLNLYARPALATRTQTHIIQCLMLCSRIFNTRNSTIYWLYQQSFTSMWYVWCLNICCTVFMLLQKQLTASMQHNTIYTYIDRTFHSYTYPWSAPCCCFDEIPMYQASIN